MCFSATIDTLVKNKTLLKLKSSNGKNKTKEMWMSNCRNVYKYLQKFKQCMISQSK